MEADGLVIHSIKLKFRNKWRLGINPSTAAGCGWIPSQGADTEGADVRRDGQDSPCGRLPASVSAYGCYLHKDR